MKTETLPKAMELKLPDINKIEELAADLRFEKATPADSEEILNLYRASMKIEGCTWSEEYPSMETVEWDLSRDSLFCIRNEKDEIVGVISIDDDEEIEPLECWSEELSPAGELSRVCVREDMQNRGIARMLFLHCMDELRERGFNGVHYLVSPTNPRALNSYRKLEFREVGQCYVYDHDYLCYEKPL